MRRREFLWAGGATAIGASGAGGAGAAEHHTLRFGTLLNPSTMDPHYAAVLGNLYTQCSVYECLTVLNADGNGIDPGLATSWRILDPLTWEFALRPGVVFHDGTPFSARSVLYSFARIPGIRNSPNPFTTNLKGITGVEAVNDTTLRLRTETAQPELAISLSRVMILPHHLGDAVSAEQFDSGQAAIGTGPYRLRRFVRGETMDLERFDAYWGGPPPWHGVSLRSIRVDAARTAALISGDVDVIDNVNIADLPSLRANHAIAMTRQQGARIMFAFLDQDREVSPFAKGPDGNNPLRDVRVRRALSLGVDRKAIMDRVLEGAGVAAGQMTIPGRDGASADLTPPEYDPRQARELLQAAGCDKNFSLTMHGTSDSYPAGERVLQSIAQYYARLGIKVTVEAETTSIAYARMNRRDFSLLFIGYGGDGFSSTYLKVLLHTKQPALSIGALNQGGYSDARVDRLIEDGLVELDATRRASLMAQAFDRALGEQQALIPFYHPIENYASRKGVATYRADAYGRLLPGRATPA